MAPKWKSAKHFGHFTDHEPMFNLILHRWRMVHLFSQRCSIFRSHRSQSVSDVIGHVHSMLAVNNVEESHGEISNCTSKQAQK